MFDVKQYFPDFAEELFEKVICVVLAQDKVETMQPANNCDFGLGVAVFTHDVAKGEGMAKNKLHAGNNLGFRREL